MQKEKKINHSMNPNYQQKNNRCTNFNIFIHFMKEIWIDVEKKNDCCKLTNLTKASFEKYCKFQNQKHIITI